MADQKLEPVLGRETQIVQHLDVHQAIAMMQIAIFFVFQKVTIGVSSGQQTQTHKG